MKRKKLTALFLTGALTASLLLGGCGERSDADDIALTCGDEELTLGYMNFVAHYTQSTYDSFFSVYYGSDYWTNEAYVDDDGLTMEESVKESVLEGMEQECVMAQHLSDYDVEITDEEREDMRAAGEEFMEENSRKGIRAMGATAEYVEQLLYYETVADRMQEAIEAEVGEDLDIADYARRTFSYIEIDPNGYDDEDGNYVEYTEDEAQEAADEAEEVAEEAKDDFDAAAEDHGYTISTYSYGEDEESEEDGGFAEAVIEEADTMKEGDVSGLIKTDDAWYIIRLDSEDDEDAAESAMESASEEMKSDHFDEVCDTWLEETDVTVDEDLWAKVKFSNLFTVDDGEEDEEEVEVIEE